MIRTGSADRGYPMKTAAVSILLLALTGASVADTFAGRVVGVTDGDTITVLDPTNRRHRIRLAAVDAPESKQPFGSRAKESLSHLVFGKPVVVEWRNLDRFDRIVGTVWVAPANCPSCGTTVDAGEAQLAAGMAWWSRRFAREQSADGRMRYESAERSARVRRVGLWSDPSPVPPWDWRRQ